MEGTLQEDGNNMLKRNGKFVGLIVLFTCVLFAVTAVAKDMEPSATVSIASTSVAIGIGVQQGDGVLTDIQGERR